MKCGPRAAYFAAGAARPFRGVCVRLEWFVPPAEAAGDPEAARMKNVRSGDAMDTDRLERGRVAYARREWLDDYESLARAHQAVRCERGISSHRTLASETWMASKPRSVRICRVT
jgi:hypothetical protein